MKHLMVFISGIIFLLSCSRNKQILTDANDRRVFGPVKNMSYCTYRAIRDSITGKIVPDSGTLFGCYFVEFDKNGFIVKKIHARDTNFKTVVLTIKGIFKDGKRVGDSIFDQNNVLNEFTKTERIDKYSFSVKTYNAEGELQSVYITKLNDSMRVISATMTTPDSSYKSVSVFSFDDTRRTSSVKTYYPGQKIVPSESHYCYYDFDRFNNPGKSILSRDAEQKHISSIPYFSYEYY